MEPGAQPAVLPHVGIAHHKETAMPKPPQSTPHSDIDGINQDEVRNTEAAARAGEGAEDLEEAAREDVARPPHSDDIDNRDDRTN